MTIKEADLLPEEPIALTPHELNRGFKTRFEEQEVHVRGISPDPRVVENYLRALRVKTSRGTTVIPAVRRIYVPQLTLDIPASMTAGQAVFIPKTESKLPAQTVDLINKGMQEGLFTLANLTEVSNYEGASTALGVNPNSFLATLTQSSQLVFVSEWAGPSVQFFLVKHSEEPEMRKMVVGSLGENLALFHQAQLIAGDTHIDQFVVREGEQRNDAVRVDLNNVYSATQLSDFARNVDIERNRVLSELQTLFPDVAEAFLEGYQSTQKL